jgi:hypothetical protein
VKVGEGSIFNTELGHKVHGKMVKKGCIVVKIEKVLKHNAPLPHPTGFEHTLGGALESYEIWPESDLEPHCHDHAINIPQDRVRFICTKVSLTHECMGTSMCIAKGMLVNVREDDIVEGETLGEMDFGVFLEEIDGNCEICRIGDKSIHCLVRWPINKLVDNKGVILRVKEKFKEPPKEMVIWDVIEDTNPLNKWDGYLCNEKDRNSIDMHVTRPYKRIKRVMATKKIAKCQTKIDEEKEIRLLAADVCCRKDCLQHVDRKAIAGARRGMRQINKNGIREFVLNSLMSNTVMSKGHGHGHGLPPIARNVKDMRFNGNIICKKAWYKIHKIPQSTFYNYQHYFQHGQIKAIHGNTNTCKARAHTVAAIEILHKIVMDNSDFSPNQTRQVEEDGTSAPLRLLPSTYTQNSLLKEINEALQKLNYPSISQSTMSKIWNTKFRDVAFSKNTNFSKCSECIVLKAQMKSATTKELEEKARGRLKKHNKIVMCGRYCYYAHRIMSERFPKEYLSIIHDKMDKTKTSIPRLRVKSKSIVGTNLGLSLTGMLTHGHKAGGFGHFSLPFVHMGSQFTITSLAKCLRDLEDPQMDMYGDLLYESGISRNPLTNALLDTSIYSKCQGYKDDFISHGSSKSQNVDFKPLPPHLLLQLDNAASDNKNRYLFMFLSLLTALGVFITIEVGFLPVGHTHEDIDGTYGRMSSNLKSKDIYSLPEMMDTYRIIEENRVFPPTLIDKVYDFKSFLNGYIKEGKNALVGHLNVQYFQFLVLNDVPVLRYKESIRDIEWSEPVELWNIDDEGRPIIPIGKPSFLASKQNDVYLKELKEGITSYIKMWKDTIGNEDSPIVTEEWKNKVVYWEKVLDTLDGIYNDHRIIDGSDSSSEDFWPKTRHIVDVDRNALQVISSIMDGDFDNVIDEPIYVGPKCNKPKPTFNPMIDVEKGKMLLVRSGNEDAGEMIWMAKSISDIFRDNESENLHVKVDWWKPMSGKYNGKFLEQYWVPNPDDKELGSIPINTIVWAWMPKKEHCKKTKINKYGVEAILDLLERIS